MVEKRNTSVADLTNVTSPTFGDGMEACMKTSMVDQQTSGRGNSSIRLTCWEAHYLSWGGKVQLEIFTLKSNWMD